MKLELVVDLELSKRAKRIAAAVLVPVLVSAGGAIAYAGSLHVWTGGDTLNAADLNSNFSTLQNDIATLQGQLASPFVLKSQNDPFGDGSQIAYLRFEGNFTDELGNFSGAAVGGPTFVTGRYGQALSITSGNYYASSNNVPISGAAPRTIAIWTKQNVDSQSDAAAIAGWGTGGTATLFYLTATIGAQQQWGLWGSSADIDSGVRADQQWHFLVASYDGVTARMFIDGQYAAQASVSLATTPNTPLSVGNAPLGGADCEVDSLRVFNRQLSPWEIQSLYYLGK